MQRINPEERSYRVVLMGIEDDTEKNRESFCEKISQNYSIPLLLLRKIIDRCPIILKKNLSLDKAETLAKTLQSFGAVLSVEEKRDSPAIFLEFQEIDPPLLALESSDLRRTQSGTWNVIGRAKNISGADLGDIWVLIQVFNEFEELVTFEEASLPINPIPQGEAFPFKVVFEGDLFIKRVSIAFKCASGAPISAVDSRKNREWVEVEIRDEEGDKSQWIDRNERSEEISTEKESNIGRGDAVASHAESQPLSPVSPENNIMLSIEGGEHPLGVYPLSDYERVPREEESETAEEDGNLESGMEKEVGILPEETSIRIPEEFSDPSSIHLSTKNGREEDIYFDSVASLDNRNDNLREVPPETPVFRESPQLSGEFSPNPSEREEEAGVDEELSPFPWIKDFRKSIDAYFQKHRDIFSKWFESFQREGGFAHSLHSLITILAHARFSQVHQSVKALENTQKVVSFSAQPSLRLEEIPLLDGTDFFTGEDWRDLFHKAFPKVQQVANKILKRGSWNATDLERLIRVIPHMSDKNSRNSVRWVHELMADVIKIDFSNTRVNIEESLYRVASRLSVVDPHFDYYQGIGSIGDLKIQSFAKQTFPQDPLIIEEPMTWVGSREEEGGHCFPTQPRCDGCLFGPFCPRFYLNFNPSGKGMRGR